MAGRRNLTNHCQEAFHLHTSTINRIRTRIRYNNSTFFPSFNILLPVVFLLAQLVFPLRTFRPIFQHTCLFLAR
jgi:hypothetical protein